MRPSLARALHDHVGARLGRAHAGERVTASSARQKDMEKRKSPLLGGVGAAGLSRLLTGSANAR